MSVDQVTLLSELLQAHQRGDRTALDRIIPLIYRELQQLARRQLRRRPGGGQSLDTTGLVHEAYLKLARSPALRLNDQPHLLALTAFAMRQVLVSRARARLSSKRGAGQAPLPLEDPGGREPEAEQLLDIDRALGRLRQEAPELASVFECRYFGGLGEEETAEALGLSLRATQRAWMRARAWLRAELEGAPLAPEAEVNVDRRLTAAR
jgi:RNA polymerase sigma factor (TIGR02999 family)